MNCERIGPIGVCSWSVNNELSKLNALRDKTGINRIHLSLNPALDGQAGYTEQFLNAGWEISATMIGFQQEEYTTLETIRKTGGIVPEHVWPQNKDRVTKAIEITGQLEVPYLEFHFGFINAADIKAYDLQVKKARELAEIAAGHNVILLMETGQEIAATLHQFLEAVDHRALAINFDPANMILYDKGNPIEAISLLSSWIRHVHIKDAVASVIKGQWGTEVPWATGQVGADEFLKALKMAGFKGTLSVEREAGEDRIGDIESAISWLASWRDSA